MSNFCPQCGRLNRDNARFCIGCGEKMGQGIQSPPLLLDNRYEILHVIKSGAMGSVYKAKNSRLGNIVAVKKMLNNFTSDQDKQYAEQRFLEEAKILANLNHPGLPKVSDYFIDKDPDTGNPSHFLVMTFIQGQDLETLISENKGGNGYLLDMEEVLDYFNQLLEILIYLHNQNPPIIYRDIKPSNIMVSPREGGGKQVVLIDFGIARIFEPQKQGTMIGTPGYASPEQYKGFAEPRSDLYSLAVVIHYLLTGMDPEDPSRAPFSFESPRKFNKKIPDYLDRIIMQMLEMRCEDRPPSAEKVQEELEQGKTLAKTGKGRTRKVNSTSPLMAIPAITPSLSGISQQRFPDIFTAIDKGNIKDIQYFIQQGVDINCRTDKDWTPLHVACYLGKKLKSELLINKGADIEARDRDGLTPLFSAVMGGNLKIINLLLSKKADINATNRFKETPLHIAVQKENTAVVQFLVFKKADVNIRDIKGNTPLELARQKGLKDIEDILSNPLKKKTKKTSHSHQSASVSSHVKTPSIYPISQTASPSPTPAVSSSAPVRYKDIFQAIQSGSPADVLNFLRQGINVNTRFANKDTLLHFAVFHGRTDIAQLLIDHGAEVNAVGHKGLTPLHYAVNNDNRNMTHLLITRGGDVNAKDKTGKTLLFTAEKNNRTHIAQMLRQFGAKKSIWEELFGR